MSQPADEVTGSQDVGSAHSQFSVPLALELALPLAGEPEAPVPDVLLPQAATAAIVTTAAAAATPRTVTRDRNGRRERKI